MTEIEQLRKELNELRERVALLEIRQPVYHPVQTPYPYYTPPTWVMPSTVCKSSTS